jgi:hypothetical protein
MRSIHEVFQPFFLEKAHEYCTCILWVAAVLAAHGAAAAPQPAQ